MEVEVSGVEIQTLAVDTRTAVWESTTENRSERNPENFRMQIFCLQLEAACLQWSFFTYS